MADVWCLVWDFTCPDTLAPSHIDLAVSGPGVLACESEVRKRLKYSNLAASYCFVPVALKTLAAVGVDATYFMHQLGRRIAAMTGERRATDYLFQRLSVAIQ